MKNLVPDGSECKSTIPNARTKQVDRTVEPRSTTHWYRFDPNRPTLGGE
jgi:hypothetical protein